METVVLALGLSRSPSTTMSMPGAILATLPSRDLEHAENTVVAYWMRYCSEALTQHDWEILAKIHKGCPQGPQREKTTYYWSKVCRHLEDNHKHVSPFPSPARPECLKVLAAERRLPIVKHARLQVRRLPFTDISSTDSYGVGSATATGAVGADYTTPVMNPDSRAMQVSAENVPETAGKTGVLSFLGCGEEIDVRAGAATPPRQTEQEEDELAKHTAKLSLADFLLEIPNLSASIEYVKALFSCENILLEKLFDKVGGLEESLDSSEPTPVPPPAASIKNRGVPDRQLYDNRLTSSLKRLCAVWEEQDVDLLTRSLRFKMLTAVSSSSELSTKEAPCIAWEIHALQNIDKSAKSRRAAKELIQQQRDKIYINIGAYASRSERHQLYSAWGVHRLSTTLCGGIQRGKKLINLERALTLTENIARKWNFNIGLPLEEITVKGS
ncbi:hypothetical protein SELMODRAFT_413249 [Selaginella moellendorffii]|uniref:lysozyme n=1 Tax=Selaginella moellendorffii TaxID=88036 RepID=D8RNU3_SELML|nr:hypothetical protein SELMODRAFT_413249 [Selaginella moellendorffii]